MGLLNKVLNFINNRSNQSLNEVTIEKAKFIKDFSMDNKQLKDLELLASKLKEGEKKEKVSRDIYYQKQGSYGENKVYFELKNRVFYLSYVCMT